MNAVLQDDHQTPAETQRIDLFHYLTNNPRQEKHAWTEAPSGSVHPSSHRHVGTQAPSAFVHMQFITRLCFYDLSPPGGSSSMSYRIPNSQKSHRMDNTRINKWSFPTPTFTSSKSCSLLATSFAFNPFLPTFLSDLFI